MPWPGQIAAECGIGLRHRRHDAVERLVPRGAAEAVGAPVAEQRMQEARGIVDDLARRLPAHAQEALAVRIGLVPRDAHQLAVAHLGQHAAQRRMAVHRTHRADDP